MIKKEEKDSARARYVYAWHSTLLLWSLVGSLVPSQFYALIKILDLEGLLQAFFFFLRRTFHLLYEQLLWKINLDHNFCISCFSNNLSHVVIAYHFVWCIVNKMTSLNTFPIFVQVYLIIASMIMSDSFINELMQWYFVLKEMISNKLVSFLGILIFHGCQFYDWNLSFRDLLSMCASVTSIIPTLDDQTKISGCILFIISPSKIKSLNS